MTAASKTERQLIDSIRKAKTGGEPAAAPASAPAKATTATKTQPPRQRAAATKVGARKNAQAPAQTKGSGYSRARRVWPD